jgi:hypothetical protein
MTLSDLLLGLGGRNALSEQVQQPNPDWVSAPYEESGIVDLQTLHEILSSFSDRFKDSSMTLTIEKTDGDLFKYLLTKPACGCVKR